MFSYAWIHLKFKASHTFILEFNFPLILTHSALTWCVLATGADAMKETLSKVVHAQYQIAAHVSLHARDLIHRLLQVVSLVSLFVPFLSFAHIAASLTWVGSTQAD